MNRLIMSLVLVVVFFSCNLDELPMDNSLLPNVEINSDDINCIVPCRLELSAIMNNVENLTWKVNDLEVSNADTLIYEIESEGEYVVELIGMNQVGMDSDSLIGQVESSVTYKVDFQCSGLEFAPNGDRLLVLTCGYLLELTEEGDTLSETAIDFGASDAAFNSSINQMFLLGSTLSTNCGTFLPPWAISNIDVSTFSLSNTIEICEYNTSFTDVEVLNDEQYVVVGNFDNGSSCILCPSEGGDALILTYEGNISDRTSFETGELSFTYDVESDDSYIYICGAKLICLDIDCNDVRYDYAIGKYDHNLGLVDSYSFSEQSKLVNELSDIESDGKGNLYLLGQVKENPVSNPGICGGRFFKYSTISNTIVWGISEFKDRCILPITIAYRENEIIVGGFSNSFSIDGGTRFVLSKFNEAGDFLFKDKFEIFDGNFGNLEEILFNQELPNHDAKILFDEQGHILLSVTGKDWGNQTLYKLRPDGKL